MICLKTALKAFDAIVSQGEGAAHECEDCHYARFAAIREELKALKAANPAFEPAFPAAVNPVLRRPVRAGPRVWIENEAGRGRRRRRQLGLHADAAADLALLSTAAAASGQGRVHRSRARTDARDDAARRSRGAPAGGSVEPGLQCRHVVHRAARRGAAAARRERRPILPRAAAGAVRGRAARCVSNARTCAGAARPRTN